jgi:hypothetical protein
MCEGSVAEFCRDTGPRRVVPWVRPCGWRRRGVTVDFGPKQSGWLINQLGDPSFIFVMLSRLCLTAFWDCRRHLECGRQCKAQLFCATYAPRAWARGACWGWSKKTRLSLLIALLTLPRMRTAFFWVQNWCSKQF